MTKQPNFREQLRSQRRALSSEQVQQASSLVASRCIDLPAFLQAQHVAYYITHENEIDCAKIIDRARELKKTLYLPIFSNNMISFYRVDDNTVFEKNKFGIVEPVVSSAAVSVESLDLIFVPLVAFDAECHRVGRGTGCYDRALQSVRGHCKPVLLGLAYEFQRVGWIVPEGWDVPMDYVFSEEALYSRGDVL